MALCDTQHAGKEIVTRSKSEYFANDPECHDLLPCALRSHRVAGLGGCPTGPPVGGVTSTSTPALWPCAVLWPCTFCSDRPVIKVVSSRIPAGGIVLIQYKCAVYILPYITILLYI